MKKHMNKETKRFLEQLYKLLKAAEDDNHASVMFNDEGDECDRLVKQHSNLLAEIEANAIHELVHKHYENKTHYCLDSDKEEHLKQGFEMVVDSFFKDLDRETRTEIYHALYHKYACNKVKSDRYL